MIKFLDLNKQYLKIKDEIDNSIKAVLKDGAFIGGNYVQSFENAFSKYNNIKYCVGVANGTDALEIAIEALNLPLKSEIIVPANSFFATSEAVSRMGYKVVFCDCNNDDYTICTEDLKKKITMRTSAIIPVHLYGGPCNMNEIIKIAKKHKLKIIEDCAQAIGAEYKGQKIGTFGDASCFSFYPGKNLGAYGDAGAIITNLFDVEKKCRMIKNHGRLTKYDHLFEGRNSRLDGIQASILETKLKYIDRWNDIRIKIAHRYLERLKDVKDIKLPKIRFNSKYVFHLFVIKTEKRDQLKTYLSENNVETGIHYPIALPDLKAYKNLNYPPYTLNAQNNSSYLLSLPIGDHMKIEDADFVINKIKSFYKI